VTQEKGGVAARDSSTLIGIVCLQQMVKNRKPPSKFELERWTITTIKKDMRLWKTKENNYEKCVHSAAKMIAVAMKRSKCNNKESEWNLLQ